MVPQTTTGKIFAGICAFSGVFIIAMPIGIISSSFSKTLQIQKRERHLLTFHRKRRKIRI